MVMVWQNESIRPLPTFEILLYLPWVLLVRLKDLALPLLAMIELLCYPGMR